MRGHRRAHAGRRLHALAAHRRTRRHRSHASSRRRNRGVRVRSAVAHAAYGGLIGATRRARKRVCRCTNGKFCLTCDWNRVAPSVFIGDAVNKSQLVDELAERFGGNRKVAAHALDSVVDVITRSVSAGDKVVITGFGAFERTVRKAGTARNPRTGDAVKTRTKFVAKFRPGNEFKDVVSGARMAPKRVAQSLAVVPATAASAAESATRAAASGLRAAAGAARRASGGRSAATKATAGSRPTTKKATMPAKKTTAKKTTAKKTTAKKSAAKKAPAKKTAAKKGATKKTAVRAAAKKSTAKKTTAKKSAAKKAPAKKSTAKKAPAKKAPAKKST